MNAQFAAGTLLIWSAQLCLLGLPAALAIQAVRHPKARLWSLQGLLLAFVLLPLVEPWRTPTPEAIPAIFDGVSVFAGPALHIASQGHHWTGADLLWFVLLGTLVRLCWLTAGLFRLRRYRKESRQLPAPPVPYRASSAQWYVHPNVSSPVTYGWPHASILLPARFATMELPLREAIACHELLHVIRRDWLFLMAEELFRAAFWFHPVVWFVLSRIQLAREQVVDREVVRLTQNRDGYVDALVAVAAHKIRPDLAPAPLFLKKRHLAIRVAEVLQEVSMSRARLYTALATACSTALIAGRLAMWLIPFSLPAQVQPDDPGITVDAGAALLHRTPIHISANNTARGTVTVEATLNTKGEVSDARVLSGPEELRKPVLESILNWHYDAGPGSVQIKVNIANAAPSSIRADGTSGPTYYIDPSWATRQFPATLSSIAVEGISADAELQLRSALPFHEGDLMQYQDLRQMEKAVSDFDSHLKMTIHVSGNGQFALLFAPPSATAGSNPEASFPAPPAGVRRVRVGGNVQNSKLINKVMPKYPSEAKQAHIQGTVSYAALIGTDGRILDLHLVSGQAILADAAVEALKQWTYSPTMIDGNPVQVVAQIDVNFTLAN
ncbi:MAG TPA: M56 family metallopeptidase [Bryobacteraceae bacterium]|nr:M56 family metallopeptidase [Bryobacteraceae bacterium]